MRYATRDASVRGEHFYGHPGDCAEPWPIHYYVWVVMYGTRVLLVDTGFTQAEAVRRGNRKYGESPIELLSKLGVTPDEVTDIVITHLHYDHTGFVGSFPRATAYLQRDELAFWESPMARRGGFSHLINSADVEAIPALIETDAWSFLTAAWPLTTGPPCILSVATPRGCRSCGLQWQVRLSFWRAMRAISTPISKTMCLTVSCILSPSCIKLSIRFTPLRATTGLSSLATIHWWPIATNGGIAMMTRSSRSPYVMPPDQEIDRQRIRPSRSELPR